MQVILNEKIHKLGDLGECVNVKAGYARNYLMPQGKAIQATKVNIALFETRRSELEKIAAEKLKVAEKEAASLAEVVLEISAKAGESGKLFGSIGTRDVAEALATQGVKVDRQMIRMPEGVLRELGEYDITLHLHTDVDVTIQVKVVEEA